MKSPITRASVGIAALILATALSLTTALHEVGASNASPTTDPSVPPASQVFSAGGGQTEGNVRDMTY
jgi:hypothetical protein